MRGPLAEGSASRRPLEVPLAVPYAAGKDPRFDAAVAVLARQVGG